MSRGVVLVAHNNGKDDYYSLAIYTAKRINRFLNLPVTIITDEDSVTPTQGVFDNIITVDPDKSNFRKKAAWINKGKHRIFELTPYTDTLILDVDYLINSDQLLKVFTTTGDFGCHNTIRWLMEESKPEYFHKDIISTLWATVVRFRKTERVEQIFQMMRMVEENYQHYSSVYQFDSSIYRNDYALTIALKTVEGHLVDPLNYFRWNLLHVSPTIKVERDGDTSYTLTAKDKNTGKNQYIKIKDIDFHLLSKANFLELTK